MSASTPSGASAHAVPATSTDAGQRVDRFLADRLDLSRSRIKQLVDEGRLRRDGQAVTGPAEALRAAGSVVWWSDGEWLILDGHWFSLKRWLGDEQQIADVYSQLSKEQATALLDGFCRADGRSSSIEYETNGQATGNWSLTHSSFPLIDHLQLIAQLAGARVSLSRCLKAGGTTCLEGRLVRYAVDHWRLSCHFTESETGIPFQATPLARPDDARSIDDRGYYQHVDDGRVYCITVDSDTKRTNANFLTQRIALQRGTLDDVRAHAVFVGNCMEEIMDCVLRDCNHFLCCMTCGQGLIAKGLPCPVCRKNIKSCMKIYWN